MENAGMGSKERKREGLREEESMKSQRRGMKSNEDEERIDKAIEEMLTECHQRALGDYAEPIDYDLGGDLEVRKRMPTSPGRGREKKSISQTVERSKQSAGMDRRQRQASGVKRSFWREQYRGGFGDPPSLHVGTTSPRLDFETVPRRRVAIDGA